MENTCKIKRGIESQNETKHTHTHTHTKQITTWCLVNNLKSKWKQQKWPTRGRSGTQGWISKSKIETKSKTKNVKITWSRTWTSTTWNGNGNNERIETDTCERKQKRDNRCILDFSLLVFKLSNYDSQIPMFFFDTFNFSFPNCHCSIFDFTVSVHFFLLIAELGFPNFDLHTIDTFKLRVPFVFLCLLTFSAFRFQNYSFLVFDLPISNIRLQMGSIQLQIVILEFAFSFHSDVRCQMLQNGWLLRMGSTHLATGMVLG